MENGAAFLWTTAKWILQWYPSSACSSNVSFVCELLPTNQRSKIYAQYGDMGCWYDMSTIETLFRSSCRRARFKADYLKEPIFSRGSKEDPKLLVYCTDTVDFTSLCNHILVHVSFRSWKPLTEFLSLPTSEAEREWRIWFCSGDRNVVPLPASMVRNGGRMDRWRISKIASLISRRQLSIFKKRTTRHKKSTSVSTVKFC